MTDYDNGVQRIREVFQQDIDALLTDHRTVQIVTILMSYPLRSKKEVLEAIGASIGDTPLEFPCPRCSGKGAVSLGFMDGVPISYLFVDCPKCKKPAPPDGTWVRESQQPPKREPDGPPGCQCAEKTRAADYKTTYDCPHCRS